MEGTVNYCQVVKEPKIIDEELYHKLNILGLIPNEVRKDNVGKSDYSKHTIQPWAIWKDYNLNPWDADIIKRVLRSKEESDMSMQESRIMDYEKIIHIAQERIRQIQAELSSFYSNKKPSFYVCDTLDTGKLTSENTIANTITIPEKPYVSI